MIGRCNGYEDGQMGGHSSAGFGHVDGERTAVCHGSTFVQTNHDGGVL